MEENNRDANQNENPVWNPPQDKREQEGRPVEPQSLPYQNNGYENGAYSNNDYQNYGNGYWQYNQQYNGAQPWPDNQTQLEEPVKISEWVLTFVLMMIPCVNIIMMFVWAFSSTEKKSKSNFFKAYLIFFGIAMGVMLMIWVFIVFLALSM